LSLALALTAIVPLTVPAAGAVKEVVGAVVSPVPPPQVGTLKETMRVDQLKAPLEGMYSVVNQKVQSSVGSTDIPE
jgi:hypothetical protein